MSEPAKPPRAGGSSTGEGAATAARVHWALFAAQLTFSGFHVLGKVVLESLDPLAVACFRVLFAGPVLLALAWSHDRVVPARRDLPLLALLGLLGVCANQILFILGLSLSTATNAAILMPSIPVFAVAVAAALGVERIGWRRLSGIGLTVAGALVVLNPAGLSLAPGVRLGNLLITVNCLCYASFLVLQRPILARLPWRTVIAWTFVFGGAGVMAVGSPRLLAVAPETVPAIAWWGLAYTLVFPTLLGYLLTTWAVGRGSAALVAAYTTLQPLLTAALAALALGEAPGGRELAGFVLVAGGLWRVSRRGRPAPPPA